MSVNEQRPIIDAWNKHLERNNISYKFATFSSAQEEEFRETFRKSILAHTKLTLAEKLKLLAYTGL